MTSVGLPPTFSALWREEQGPQAWLYMAEVDGFLTPDDPRLGKFQDILGKPLKRLMLLGGYAAPLTAEELGPLVPRAEITAPAS